MYPFHEPTISVPIAEPWAWTVTSPSREKALDERVKALEERLKVLEQNLGECIKHFTGEANALEQDPDTKGLEYIRGRIDALRDAAEAVKAAMASEEYLVNTIY